VPDLGACKNTDECTKALADVGLIAEQVHASMEPGDSFKVLNVSPPAGTSVPEGCVVHIVTLPAKVVVTPPDQFANMIIGYAHVLQPAQ